MRVRVAELTATLKDSQNARVQLQVKAHELGAQAEASARAVSAAEADAARAAAEVGFVFLIL